jgi:hypothetical protein
VLVEIPIAFTILVTSAALIPRPPLIPPVIGGLAPNKLTVVANRRKNDFIT